MTRLNSATLPVTHTRVDSSRMRGDQHLVRVNGRAFPLVGQESPSVRPAQDFAYRIRYAARRVKPASRSNGWCCP